MRNAEFIRCSVSRASTTPFSPSSAPLARVTLKAWARKSSSDIDQLSSGPTRQSAIWAPRLSSRRWEPAGIERTKAIYEPCELDQLRLVNQCDGAPVPRDQFFFGHLPDQPIDVHLGESDGIAEVALGQGNADHRIVLPADRAHPRGDRQEQGGKPCLGLAATQGARPVGQGDAFHLADREEQGGKARMLGE